MTLHLQVEIENLKKRLLSLGALVEDSFLKAVEALVDRNANLARTIIENDREIDLLEVKLEEECLKVLALHQPVAVDLRFIVAILKINSDLERIGDLAVNMAERVVHLAKHAKVELDFDYQGMAKNVESMVAMSLDALVNMDADLARRVCEMDDEIDFMNREAFEKVQSSIRKNPDEMESLLHYMSVSRHLERIADHATNIAEDVVYMVEGNIVRHRLGPEKG